MVFFGIPVSGQNALGREKRKKTWPLPHSRRAFVKTHKTPCCKCIVVSILIFVLRFNSYKFICNLSSCFSAFPDEFL